MAENIFDVNTEDEENMKETRHDRAAAKILRLKMNLLVQKWILAYCLFYQIRRDFLDHKNYFIRISLHGFWQPMSIRLFHPRKTVRYQKVSIIEKRKPKIIQQETKRIAKNKELEDESQQDFQDYQ